MNAMKQCLRCGKFCKEPSIFCESCQSSLLNSAEQKRFQTEPMPCPTTKMIKEGDIDSTALGRRPLPWVTRRAAIRRTRRMFIALALLVIAALIIDGILVTLVLKHSSYTTQRRDALPLLTLAPGIVYLGQVVQLHLSHFPPFSRVLLTHDIQEPLRVDVPSSQISIGTSGNATARVLIEGNWGVGMHFIAAEDISTRYTASATLQDIGSGPVLPPQLLLSHFFLDMGSDWKGADTLRALNLSYSGGGTISWVAKSNQPWLQLTPAQGVFSDNQKITVVATRVQMKPGNYQATLSIVSNTGVPAFIQVKMSVHSLPASTGPLLAVTPPVLAFSANDGEREPPDQSVTLNNPGPIPLAWSLAYSTPTATVNQSIPFRAIDWLSASPASGVLAPHATTTIHVGIHSHVLFPSVYTGLLSISGRNALDTPQVVPISLTVQRQCGIVTDAGMMSFIATVGQQAADSQSIGLHTTIGCPGAVTWSAFTLANWLAVAPANGELWGQNRGVATVSVAGKLLQPGIFTGLVVFLMEHRTQTISVQLTVLPASSNTSSGKIPYPARISNTLPGSASSTGKTVNGAPVVVRNAARAGSTPPVLSVSPSQLAFTVSQGQASRGPQHLILANAGGSALIWRASIRSSATSWLTLAAMQGTIGAEQTIALMVDTNAGNLVSGTYNTQIVVSALDNSDVAVAGSPQVISVILTVAQPCVLQVTPTTLSFSSSLLQANPADQAIHLNVTGNCSLPISWQVSSSNSDWLVASPLTGTENGTGSSVNMHVNTSGILLGSYNGQIIFSAQDNTGASVSMSSQMVSVNLDVLG